MFKSFDKPVVIEPCPEPVFSKIKLPLFCVILIFPVKVAFPELDIVNLLELASKSAIKNSPALLLPNSYFFPLVAPVMLVSLQQTHRL